MQSYDRPNSAYMLFYERADSLEPVTMMEEIAAAAPQEAASLATGVPVSAIAEHLQPDATQVGCGLSALA